MFKEDLSASPILLSRLWTLSGLRLVCHCVPSQLCHGDILIQKFTELYPSAFDRSSSTDTPNAATLSYLAALREEPPSDPGSSADEGAPPAGSGWTGIGSPMTVGTGYTARPFCDGQSLASPGRWVPDQRRYPSHPTWSAVSSLFSRFTATYGSPELLMQLALGKVDSSPFGQKEMAQLKADVIASLHGLGLQIKTSTEDSPDVLLDYRFLEILLAAAHDPDVSIGSFASGVRVGPGVRLPRLPALYKAKKRWSLPEQSDPVAYLEEVQATDQTWRRNYPAVATLSAAVTEVLEDHARRGQVLKLTEHEAKSRYPGLVVASLGANKKEKPGGVITARVLHDGTNGVSLNRRIRLRDQERCPIASDIKRVMREKARTGERSFALTADVKKAHRQIPIVPRDWHLLGCQVTPGSSVYINKVGTFGKSSASYYWSRVAGALGRLSQYLIGGKAKTWHLLVADDFHLDASGPEYRSALLMFFVLCDTCRVPLSWAKTSGGDTVAWVGFELLHSCSCLGISQRRADWFVKRSLEVASSTYVNMSRFEEGLGRIMFVAGALEYEKPCMGPLYRFLSLHPRGSIRRVPAYVTFILKYLAHQVSQTRYFPCSMNITSIEQAPRVDAQASSERTGIGGWLPELDSDGQPSPSTSRWFSHAITKEEFPWVFERGGKPSLLISSLEALAIIIALKVFFPAKGTDSKKSINLVPTWTDNRGNGPASALLMERASHMKHERIKASVSWAPREVNKEADRLANGDTTGFDPNLRLHIAPSNAQVVCFGRGSSHGQGGGTDV